MILKRVILLMLPRVSMKMLIRSLRMRIMSLIVWARPLLEVWPGPLRIIPVSLFKILVLPDEFRIAFGRRRLIDFHYAHVINQQHIVSGVRADDICRHGCAHAVVEQGVVLDVRHLTVIGENDFAFGSARFEYIDFVIVIFGF